MKIAIPLNGDEFCAHFGHSSQFALFEIAPGAATATSRVDVPAPAHEHGAFPAYLHEHGVTVVLAGGLGARARQLFAASGIEVVSGVAPSEPEALVTSYLAGSLVTGVDVCEK